MKLTSENFLFDPRPNYPFLLTAKRYRLSKRHPPDRNTDTDLTLILTHCTMGHKEQWEPLLEHLWSGVSKQSRVLIREAWTIDFPNHGNAAVLNEEALKWGYRHVFCWDDFARCIHLFISAEGSGIPKNYFRGHNLVGIGQSVGAIGILLSQSLSNTPNWVSMILIEPMTCKDEEPLRAMLLKFTESRRDIWPSKKAAFEAFSTKGGLKFWDKRILKLYCEYGLRKLPTSEYPDTQNGVTLSCTKIQEAATYRDRVALARAYHYTKHACSLLPIHVIYGDIDDYISKEAKEDYILNAAQGKFASVRRVPGGGHLIPQISPEGVAEAVFCALNQIVDDLSHKVYTIPTTSTQFQASSRL